MTEWVSPDRSRSRAVLVGTSEYTELPSVPAAAHSLRRMHQLLTGPLCGWPANRVDVVADQRRPADLPDRLVELYGDALDVALFYYVGHGQVDFENRLCLGLTDSRLQTERRATTSLTFDAVRQAMAASPAKVKVVILDCCFAGRAVQELNTLAAPGADMAALAGATGAYVLAATDAGGTAWFESAEESRTPHTYFTKFLAELVEGGIPGEPTGLTLAPIYRQLREDLPAAGKPSPVRISRDDGHAFLFARNAAAAVPTSPDPAERIQAARSTTGSESPSPLASPARSRSRFRGRRPRRRTVVMSAAGVLALVAAVVVPLATSSSGTGTAQTIPLADSTADDVVHAVAYSANGRLLAAGSGDGMVRLWNLPSGGPPTSFRVGADPAQALAFSPDGKTLAVGGGHATVELRDVATKKTTILAGTGENTVVSVSFSDNGKSLAVGDTEGAVWLWDLAIRRPTTLRTTADKVYAVAFWSDNTILIGGGDPSGAVLAWDTAHATAEPNVAMPDNDTDVVRALAYSPDGTLLAAGGNASDVKLWDVATKSKLFDFRGPKSSILSVAFNPNGKILAAGSADGSIWLWDTTTKTKITSFPGSHDVESVAFSPDGKTLASGGADHRVHLWKVP
ncbi:caspase, EACC1-associated type [Streptomyces mirabilis]|uniref:caspase, EACC1-associated type n=1 Tax=Streptomyces mirabilis TaxID=68239 RepID=UPI00365362D9